MDFCGKKWTVAKGPLGGKMNFCGENMDFCKGSPRSINKPSPALACARCLLLEIGLLCVVDSFSVVDGMDYYKYNYTCKYPSPSPQSTCPKGFQGFPMSNVSDDTLPQMSIECPSNVLEMSLKCPESVPQMS